MAGVVARIPEHFILQVQQATDIVDLIGQHVSLRQRGKNFQGLCPFHREKTPSFSVSPIKQFFKCFGCGAGGGVFQFVMQQQKCTFPEAVRQLAERAGIRMPDTGGPPTEAGMDRADLLRLMEFAVGFYRQQLQGPEGAEALAYARQRELTDESMERFGIGYAPQAWDRLCRSALSSGFSEKQLLAVGLVAERQSGGCYDRFRNRLMFPIMDVAGRVIAFGGRALSSEERAKYLNSPETVLFDKSSNLYGMSWARQEVSRGDQVVVVEGYFDVLMPVQAGIEAVVATLGTALTERHVRMLSRLASDVVVVFDADAAGVAAAGRAMELFIQQQINVRVAAIPDGKDPCDFVLAAGADAFRAMIDEAPDALEYAWRKQSAEMAGSGDLVGKRQAAEEFLRLVGTSAAYGAIDPVRQGLLVNRLSHTLGISSEHVAGQMRRYARRVPTASGGEPPMETEPAFEEDPVGPATGLVTAQRIILEVLIADPEMFDQAARSVGVEDFTEQRLRIVASHVWRLGAEGELGMDTLLGLEGGPEWGRLVTDLASVGSDRGNYAETLAEAVEYIDYHRRRGEQRALRDARDDDSLRRFTQQRKRPDARRRPSV